MSHRVLKLPHNGNDNHVRVVFTPRGVEPVSREAQSFVEVSRGTTAKPSCHPTGRMTMTREEIAVA